MSTLFDMMLAKAPKIPEPGVYLKATRNPFSDEEGLEPEILIATPDGKYWIVWLEDGEMAEIETADKARYDAVAFTKLDLGAFKRAWKPND